MKKVLTNSLIFTGTQWLNNHVITINNGKIESIKAQNKIEEKNSQEINLKGKVVIPGMVDLQINGGKEFIFNDRLNREGLHAIAQDHLEKGTTSFLITIISDDIEKLIEAIQIVKEEISNIDNLKGIHLEGPFLNKLKKGVHQASKIRQEDKLVLEHLSSFEYVKMITVAPECVTQEWLKLAQEAGVIISIGHSLATYKEAESALKNGATGFTHLWNAMREVKSRDGGLITKALLDENSYCSIIADGHHLADEIIKLTINTKKRGKVLLVSDATFIGKQKNFNLMNKNIILNGNKLVDEEENLAGSNICLFDSIKYLTKQQISIFEECIRMASKYPSAWIGTRTGEIKENYEADFIVLTGNNEIEQVWNKGKLKISNQD